MSHPNTPTATFSLTSMLTNIKEACFCMEQVLNLHQKGVGASRVLERWLCEGVVHDPYGEFMIQEHKVISKSPSQALPFSQDTHMHGHVVV